MTMEAVWLLHGILAFIAWGVLSPIATIIASVLYDGRCRRGTRAPETFTAAAAAAAAAERESGQVLPNDANNSDGDTTDGDDNTNSNSSNDKDATWIIKLHRYLCETVILLTWILFFVAVGNTKPGHHFTTASKVAGAASASASSSVSASAYARYHKVVGLCVFICTLPLWGLGRIVMPPKTKKKNHRAAATTTTTTTTGSWDVDDSVVGEITALIPSSLSISPSSATNMTLDKVLVDDVEIDDDDLDIMGSHTKRATVKPSLFSLYFVAVAHRCLGFVVSVGSLWEVWSGMILLAGRHRRDGDTGDDGADQLSFYNNLFLTWCGLMLAIFIVLTAWHYVRRSSPKTLPTARRTKAAAAADEAETS